MSAEEAAIIVLAFGQQQKLQNTQRKVLAAAREVLWKAACQLTEKYS